MYSSLKRRKKTVKINNVETLLKILVSGVLQGSILWSLVLNLFVNDLFIFIKKVCEGLRIILDDYESHYNALLQKSGKSTIKVAHSSNWNG